MTRRRPKNDSRSFSERVSALRQPRVLLATAGAIGLAGMTMANAMANASNFNNASFALGIRSSDAVATTLQADALMARAGRDPAKLAAVRQMAVRALETQPLNGRALRIVGIADALRNGPEAGKPILEVANRQNRRDMFTQLWMFGVAADANDVPRALAHYDAAVRVTPESWDLMFPMLISSLRNADVARGFVPYMRESNPWMGEFVRQAVRTTRNPEALALALAGGTLPDTAEMHSLEDELVAKLINLGHFSAMRRLVGARSSSALAAATRADLAPRSFGPRFQPLHWALDEANGASVDESNGVSSPRIRVEILRGVSSVVASKFLTLAPGSYRFTTRSSFARPVAQASFRWRLRCWRDGGYAIAWRSDPIVDPRHTLAATIDVAANCPAAMLELEAVGPTYATDTEFMVETLSLTKE